MKSINKQPRMMQIKYPRDTPRISRKRIWANRNEWRGQPEGATYPLGTQMIDQQMETTRTQPTLADTPYKGLPGLMARTGRVAINKT